MTTTIDGTNGIGLPSTGSLKFNGASSTSVSLVASPTGTTSLTLPSSTGNLIAASGTGTAGQVLTSTGGSLPVWAAASGGGLFGSAMSTTPTQANTGLTTWVAQDTATAADNQTGISLTKLNRTNTVSGLVKSAPATPFKLTALISPIGAAETFTRVGIAFYNPVSTAIRFHHIFGYNQGTETIMYNSPTSFGYYIQYAYGNNFQTVPRFLRIENNGVTATYSFSQDGGYFLTAATESVSNPTDFSNIGIFMVSQGTSGGTYPNNIPIGLNLMSWTIS